MRKLFWCGGMLSVFAALAVYLAADYAERHPDSVAAHCVHGAYHVAVDYHPLVGLGACACKMMSDTMDTQHDDHEAADACAAGKPCHAPKPMPPMEVIDLSLEAAPVCGTEPADGDFIPQQIIGQQFIPVGASVPAGDIEESEEVVPGTMPPAEDDPPVDVPDDSVVVPPTDLESPAIEEVIQEEVDLKHIVDFWNMIFGTTDDAASPSADEPPTEGSAEESEMHPGAPPDCREDPNAHQRYPGCPFLGGRQCPTTPETKPDATPKAKKKHHADAEHHAMSDPAFPTQLYHDRPAGSDETPEQPEVDTMEFRPSDAKPGEFDPKPH